MRRPVFKRWIKKECLRIANRDDFSLVKLTALAQSSHAGPSDRVSRKRLLTALHLYAMANDCNERFQKLVYNEAARKQLEHADAVLAGRDIQRLALRGTPMLSLPREYVEILQDYVNAYHAPELAAEEKQGLQRKTRQLQLQLGATSAEIARATGLAPTNVSAYLVNADVDRLTLQSARDMLEYLEELAQ